MDIKELQEKLAGILFEVDKVLKEHLDLETRLVAEFNKLMIENLNLATRSNLYANIIKLHDAGKNVEEIKKGLQPFKVQVAKKVRTLNNQIQIGKTIKANSEKYDVNQIKDFEDTYAEILRLHHPLISLTRDNISITTFNTLRQFYMSNSIDSFNGVLNEHPIPVHNITDEEKALEQYEKSIKLYEEQYEKIKNEERFKKIEDVLSDETKLAREEANIRQINYKLKEDIEKLKKKIDTYYPNGIDEIIK